jgi:hypothetical protein
MQSASKEGRLSKKFSSLITPMILARKVQLFLPSPKRLGRPCLGLQGALVKLLLKLNRLL